LARVLGNHIKGLVAVDSFTVPSATFHVLFVFVVLAHHRRRVLHFNVTEHPTAEWTAQQVVEAFPWDTAPRIRREILDHVIILGESHLRRLLADYLDYYQLSRTHLSLDKDAPDPRDVQPPTMGEVVALPKVGGLHHRYERRTA
jgi:hypothetical protein